MKAGCGGQRRQAKGGGLGAANPMGLSRARAKGSCAKLGVPSAEGMGLTIQATTARLAEVPLMSAAHGGAASKSWKLLSCPPQPLARLRQRLPPAHKV